MNEANENDTASSHLVEAVPTTTRGASAAQALEVLRGSRFTVLDAIYIVDERGVLAGIAETGAVLSAPPATSLADLTRPPPPAIRITQDQEAVASHAIEHGLTAVPVIDEHGRLLGVVPPRALIEILRHEHVEDLHRLAGMSHEAEQASRAIESPPVVRARARLPWLLVGLAGSGISALVMQRFEASLQAQVAIAFFLPGIVYLADAVGTQSEAIAVRGLSLSRKPLAEVIGGELRTGILMGLVLAALALMPVWLFTGQIRLALAVAISLAATACVATVIGFALPWLLARQGVDPAFGSGPVATIVQDLLSLAIYLIIATALVS